MEKYFDRDWPEIEDDHIPPYQHAVCVGCEGSIKPQLDFARNTMEWSHVMAGHDEHEPEPANGTFDMFPPATIISAIGHTVDYYIHS